MSLKKCCRNFNGGIKMVTQYLRCLVVMGLTCPGLLGQNVTIDWPTRTSSGCPAEVSRSQSVNVVVARVNTILYEYKVDIEQTPRVINDVGELPGLFDTISAALKATGTQSATCQTALQAVEGSLKAVQDALASDKISLKKNDKGLYPGVTRDATEEAWLTVQKAVAGLDTSVENLKKVKSTCTEGQPALVEKLLKEYEALKVKIEAIQKRVNGPREIQVSTTFRPDNDYKITVKERYNGDVTEDGEHSFECKPQSGILTLSAGYLLTTVQDRSYVRRSIPGAADSDPAKVILAVEGTGKFHPTGVALLNYQVPWVNREDRPFGFTISAGPTIKIGSNSDTSAFGLFTGISVHLWRRLFLTPGWHLGQFADFPPGFYPGRVIPDSITELSPVKRWTVRFAFGVSFRAATLANANSSDTTKAGQ
jgi:hypothetical protein